MSIDKISGGPQRPLVSPARSESKPGARSNARGGDDSGSRSDSIAAYEAEKDANLRIHAASQGVRDAEKSMTEQLERVKGDYAQQSLAESARQENAYEVQKNKGYERLRDLQRAQQAEINRVRREGERDLVKMKEYYGDSIRRNSESNDDTLQKLRNDSSTQMNYEKQLGTAMVEQTKAEAAQQHEAFKQQSDAKFAAVVETSRQDYERISENSAEAQERSETKFQQKFEKINEDHESILNDLNARTGEQIREVREGTAHKLAAYESRQNDPFYKMIDLNTDFTDIGDSYVLTAKIPQHEQGRVSVSIKGNQLVVTGYRRNEEKLEIGPGRFKGTASHQTFSESYPLAWPVDGKKLEKIFDGDELIVRVPKKQEYSVHTVYQADGKKVAPGRERVSRPKFPENLPDTLNTNQRGPAEADAEQFAQGPVPKSKGQRTLT